MNYCTIGTSPRTRGAFLLLTAIFGWGALASGQSLGEAVALSHAGKFTEAEQVYRLLLEKSPDDLELLLASSYNHAWMGEHGPAEAGFKQVLSKEKKNTDAKIGIGYARLYARDFANAIYPFLEVLREYPGYVEARKGLAYSYLWAEKGEVAMVYFKSLVADFPNNAEFLTGLGQAHLLAGENKKARENLYLALGADPSHAGAMAVLNHLRAAPPLLAVDVWAGLTHHDSDRSKLGLRSLQATLFRKGWFWSLKYDNSLGQDILNLAQIGRNAPSASLGASHQWNGKWLSNLEYGVRDVPESAWQHFFNGSQVFFLPSNFHLKAGGFLGINPGLPGEWMVYASAHVPATQYLSFEPTYYIISPFNIQRPEHRAQLMARLRSRAGYELNLSGVYGYGSIAGPEVKSRHLAGWQATGLLPFSRVLWAMFSVRHESGYVHDITNYALGLRYRLER